MYPKIPNILTPDNLTTIRGKQITTWLFISRTKRGADSTLSPLIPNPYVTVIAIDFSKDLFDTIRHFSLPQKLDIPEHVYNWILDFLQGHSHCTVYNGQSSDLHM